MRVKGLLLTIFILFNASANCYDGMFFTTKPRTIIFPDSGRRGISVGMLSRMNNRIPPRIPRLNFGKISLVSKKDVFSQYNLKALEYISFEKLSSTKRLETLKNMSSEYCQNLINSMKELKKKFKNDNNFRKIISSWTSIGEFETTKQEQSWVSWIIRPWKKSIKDHAMMKFANHMIDQAKRAKDTATKREQEDNAVQQDIHNKVVNSLDEWSQVYSSNRNLNNIEKYSELVVGSAKKALEYKEARNYKSAYFFSDFCSGVVKVVKHGILGVARGSGEALECLSDGCKGLMYACSELEIGRTAGYLMQRMGHGLDDSRVDILNCLKKAKSYLLGHGYEPIKYDRHETCLVEKLEGLGDFLQCASRSIVDGSAIFIAVLAVACIAEPFIPAVIGQTAFNLSGDGTLQVVSEEAVPVSGAIATALAEVMPFCEKLAEGVAHFFAGNGGDGGKGYFCRDNIPFSKFRKKHILQGDDVGNGGGHLWPGKPGKSVFPKSWSPEKIIAAVKDIVSDVNIVPKSSRGIYVLEAVRDGVKIRVVVDPYGAGVITAFPIK